MKRSLLAAAAATVALLLTAASLRAWDAGGHMLVTEIAAREVKPEVMEKITPLLPLLDSRFNTDTPYNFVTAGVWLDDVKGAPKEFPYSRRHYINLEAGKKPERPTQGENAYSATEEAVAILQSDTATKQEQALALAHLLHIIGDIHQPLHVASRKDRGGNGYLLVPLRPPRQTGNSFRPFNLHTFWDRSYRHSGEEEEIIEAWRYPSTANRPSGPRAKGAIAKEADRLLAAYPAEKLPELKEPTGDPDVWRWIEESHGIASKSGWPPGPPPKSNEVGRLTPEFVEASQQIAERRIVLAGHRLAALLTAIYSKQLTQ